MQRNYTAEDVKRYRDEHSCSVFEAKGHFERQHFLEAVGNARQNQDLTLLCDVVEELVKRARFT